MQTMAAPRTGYVTVSARSPQLGAQGTFAAGYPVAAARPATSAGPMTVRPVAAPAANKDSPWGGGCAWQYDKTAFKTWLKGAFANPAGPERKELYGYLSECFLDADGDRDGLISHQEFDFLIEKAAAMPRRFGLAPSWVECYGDVAHRQQARNEMFTQMDRHQRGFIGMEEWVGFAMSHIKEKVFHMDMKMLDFSHLEHAGADQFIMFCATAVSDKHSEQYKSLYEFLFKCFVESDVEERGKISLKHFDVFVEDAAQAPRALGLAPPSAQMFPSVAQRQQARQALFEKMDSDSTGTVTFDKVLAWALPHIALKVQEAISKQHKSSSGQGGPSPWGGGCAWQYDKTAFKTWVKAAIDDPRGSARKELYGYLSECFLDADGDRDGLISHEEFDFLIEKAAAMPRRFGLAPSWVECYGDVAHRQQARNEMFTQMDRHQRGFIGMEEWVAFAISHITEKVGTINWMTLDFAHLERTGPLPFIKFLEVALSDRHSEQYKSLYEHLFKTFVESDLEEKGAISFDQFDVLIDDAATVPRTLGLAPSAAQSYPTEAQRLQARRQEFDQMDTDRAGTVSFDKFLNWCLQHIAGKVQDFRAQQQQQR